MPDYGYKEVGSLQKLVLEGLNEKFKELEQYIENNVPIGRRRSLSITKIEEAAMWAAKAVSKDYVER